MKNNISDLENNKMTKIYQENDKFLEIQMWRPKYQKPIFMAIRLLEHIHHQISTDNKSKNEKIIISTDLD